ncbi:uncharacterized protein FOMMEDRAFT_128966 [Fomitiporia mediterranea MF3/22]|uniref:uncharacterized protein n=1 Tax=Fomitiporia mediterranea (strain MF3/22) TaxID=694068 RepID=UPI0004408B08|nr:uncharacterized protein FOMMEDRAFT_128966 [Fomitiporia mediterranea MF3/22]EJC98665.1 hypothetical protein FOMMEDRAFT_128966 [Fomitiporia mediterranea MF3/22]
MGKAQKKRAVRRHNPVRVPDSHLPKGLEAAAATSAHKDAVLPTIQKLESVDALERTWACSAVSNLIQNDPSTRRLLQGKNIVGVLITRLSDSVEEVVVEASGALRNLCIDGGYDICAEMYNKNILAPLQTFIPKISTALHHIVTSPKSAPESASRLVYELAENVITLLWCLSETSNKALNAINAIHLIPFLMAFLENRNKLPSRTVAAAAQCLYVLTDDNPPAIDELRSNSSYTSCILSVSQGDSLPNSASAEVKELAEVRLDTLKLLAAGILRNIQPIPAPSAASVVDIDRTVILPLVLPILSSISLKEASERVTELVQGIDEEPNVDRNKTSLKNAPKSDHKSPSERELEGIEAKLRNVQLGLEILTGICATLPDPEPASEEGDDEDEDVDIDEDENGDDIDGDEEANGKDVEMDISDPEGEVEPKPNGTSISATSFLPSILPSLLPLIHPTPLSFPPLPSTTSSASTAAQQKVPTHLPTTSALSAIHISALECLNNACLALSLAQEEQQGGSAGTRELRADVEDGRQLWDALWSALSIVGLEGGRGQERRREIWEVAVGVMWGVGGIWKGCIEPKEEQITLLIQLCSASQDAQIKVKCIGALESLAIYQTLNSANAKFIEANRVISNYLLSLLSPPTSTSTPSQTQNQVSPEPIFQAASSIIDIYSDEISPYDVNFRQHNCLQSLANAIPNVRRAVRSVDKKKEGGRELRARGEEVLENLRAFVKYRRELKL